MNQALSLSFARIQRENSVCTNERKPHLEERIQRNSDQEVYSEWKIKDVSLLDSILVEW